MGGGGGDGYRKEPDFQVSIAVIENRTTKKWTEWRVSIYSNRKSNNQKMDRVARRGPLGRAPGTLKWGHFGEKTNFQKKSHKN